MTMAPLRRNHPFCAVTAWVVSPNEQPVGSDQLMFVCVGRCGRPRRKVELGEDVADVSVDGASAHEQLGGDALGGLACGEQAKHRQIPRGSPLGLTRLRDRKSAV